MKKCIVTVQFYAFDVHHVFGLKEGEVLDFYVPAFYNQKECCKCNILKNIKNIGKLRPLREQHIHKRSPLFAYCSSLVTKCHIFNGYVCRPLM